MIDLDRGRRPGTQADFEDLVKLNQMLDTCAFHSGHPVEPIDTPANTRHLTSARAWHTLSDKVVRVYALGGTRARDEVARAVTLSSIALACGFALFFVSELPLYRQFALGAVVGIALAWFWDLKVLGRYLSSDDL